MSHRIHQECFYCDATFVTSRSAQGDHMPIPQRHGGIATVPCCSECHSLKDRIGLADWSPAMLGKVCADFPKLSRETRLFLGKCMALFSDAAADA